ncbi:MAG: sigma-70 family RNA polymerase sigma factor [Thermoleophilia bacterium]|nr:sigma-70 family RNA polymerase sigma factor [Thermoleophilia bacterium]
MPLRHPSDAELVARCRAGDADAWRLLVERFSRYVYAIAVQAYRLSSEDADDVFQEVFSRVYERLDQLRRDDAVRPWIGQLTRRICLDRIRERSTVDLSDEELEPRDLDETVERLEQAWHVHELLGTLSEPCREILDRFFAQDQSYRTIGEALELPAGTIASRISRCLAALRRSWETAEGRIEPSEASSGKTR